MARGSNAVSGRWWGAGAIGMLLLALVVGSGAAATRLVQDATPATSDTPEAPLAVAQGVETIPAGEIVWRVAARTVEPDAESGGERNFGFIVGADGSLLVTDEPGARQTLIGPGEALLVRGGQEQRRAAAGDRPADYYALEIVPATASEGEGVVFAGSPFTAPSGQRDVELVGGRLAPDAVAEIAADEAPLLVLATAGELRVEGSDGATAALASGEAAMAGGQVRVTATGDDGATYVAARIGAEPGAAEPRGTPSAAGTPVGGSAGAIAVTTYGCPSDLRPAEFSLERCDADRSAVELELRSTTADSEAGEAIDPAGGDLPVWSGLALGEYILRVSEMVPGYDRFFVPGLEGVASAGAEGREGQPPGDDGGYRVRLVPSAAAFRLDLYAFASDADGAATGTPAAASGETGSIAFRAFVCPNVTLATFDPGLCSPVDGGYGVTLSGAANTDLDAPLSLADAEPGAEDALVWNDLPFDTYTFVEAPLPAGAVNFYMPETPAIRLLADNSGYSVTIDAESPNVTLDVYALWPAALPPTPVPASATQPPPVPTAVPQPTQAVAPTQVPEPPVVDTDGDSLTDDVELGTYGTDPGVFDTDGDGTGDGAEIAAGTDPFTPDGQAPPPAEEPPPVATDSDGDGLADADEATYGANPNAPDTDGDSYGDGAEVAAGTDPANSSSSPAGSG